MAQDRQPNLRFIAAAAIAALLATPWLVRAEPQSARKAKSHPSASRRPAYGPARQPPSRVKALALTGGGSPEDTMTNYYEDTGAFVSTLDSLGVPIARRRIYFGHAGGRMCHTDSAPEVQRHIRRLRETALRSFPVPPQACAEALDYMGSGDLALDELIGKPGPEGRRQLAPFQAINVETCNYDRTDELKRDQEEGKATPRATLRRIDPSLGDFNGDGRIDVNGDATLANLRQGLNDLKLVRGDHLLLNILDHGMKVRQSRKDGVTATDWRVHLNDGEMLWASDLRALLLEFNQKGVTAHVNVQACFSGGFVRELSRGTETQGAGATCVTSHTSEDLIAYRRDAIFQGTMDAAFQQTLGAFGSQLEALACSMANDPLNKPRTSLDLVVDAGLAAMGAKVGETSALPKGLDGRAGLRENAERVRRAASRYRAPPAERLRENLMRLFQEKFARRLALCMNAPLGPALAIKRNLSSCRTQDQAVDSQIQDLMRSRTGPDFALNVVDRHAYFLKIADELWLKRYKEAICCLAYDLRGGAVPAVCR